MMSLLIGKQVYGLAGNDINSMHEALKTSLDHHFAVEAVASVLRTITTSGC